MQRDMDLIRKILFVIEGKYVDTWLPGSDVQIDGYDMKTIAYHCALLHDAGLIYDYKAQYAGDGLYFFGVGRLTWEGHELLDKIKSDTVWNKTKETIINYLNKEITKLDTHTKTPSIRQTAEKEEVIKDALKHFGII